jgi:membrane protein YdbS with pleckstrin-like domain
MQPIRALRVAAEAEGLRLRSQAQRTAVRVAMGLIALVFLTAALVFLHLALWYVLRLALEWSQYSSAAVVAAVDIILAVLLGMMAARSSPGQVEREALEVRQRAMTSFGSTLAVSTMVIPVVRVMMDKARRRR